MKKICIISNQHLSKNPRVWKEAILLTTLGYNIVILTAWNSPEVLKQDYKLLADYKIKYVGVIDLIFNGKNTAKKLFIKIRKRFALEMKKRFNIDTSWLLGAGSKMFFKAALDENADLYIVHVEFGFHIGQLLTKAGKKVGFDFEDWYSQDYLVPGRPVKLLQHLESFALQYGKYCTCPSRSMADALKAHHNIEKEISIIYNGFSVQENKMIENHFPNKIPSLIWFSQTIGPGRGLETLIQSLEILDIPITLNLIGNCCIGYDENLKSIFPFYNKHTLFFYPTVPHSELLPLIAQNDIGLALENNFPGNKDTTVSNKILQYAQAGIKTLATNTQGQIEVAAYFPETIKIVTVNKPEEWAQQLKYLINSPKVNKREQFEIFIKHFSWEAQEKKLTIIVKKVFQPSE